MCNKCLRDTTRAFCLFFVNCDHQDIIAIKTWIYLDPSRLRDLDPCSPCRWSGPGRRSSSAEAYLDGYCASSAESSEPDQVEWERRQHHVTSIQQLGETPTNHHLKEKVSKVCFSSGGRFFRVGGTFFFVNNVFVLWQGGEFLFGRTKLQSTFCFPILFRKANNNKRQIDGKSKSLALLSSNVLIALSGKQITSTHSSFANIEKPMRIKDYSTNKRGEKKKWQQKCRAELKVKLIKQWEET